MNWNKLLLLLLCNIIFSQGNYQILTTPNNFNDIFKIGPFSDNKKSSLFYLTLPANIDLFSINIPFKKYTENPNNDIYINFTNLNFYIELRYIRMGCIKAS